ncbi:putative MFS-type transporter [Tolypocladium ophioglossoides CBS 100239]|uniref:Putative MFS-type transporter n=1 Tax=Tolypocladium ophioglossoides (strain CBS 100239) TaxID=1163406 RepID=A0A0L0NBA6_TOLOC|nr:putative MFS-type transporter [Tolypocladium ophioglossoides CBS 100239]
MSSPSAVQQDELRQPEPSSPDEPKNDSKKAEDEAEPVVGSCARTEVASIVLVSIDNDNVKSNISSDEPRPKVYHAGWRLHALTAGLCVSLLLSTLETTIVSTSLVSIVDALHGFDKSGWVVTSYLLTYTGFLIIYSKFSDILGCKLMILCSITLFTVFSVACGLSNSMLPLIVFRAFQGMGASGIYSLSIIMVPLMVPRPKYATYLAIITSVFAVSSVLGPLLGGAITDHTTWRWVFFLNGPGGALAASLLAFSIPFGFPYGESTRFFRSMISEQAWKRIDFLGAFISLAASILLVFALQQGGVAYPWSSGAIISVFVLSGLLWLGFIAWERQLSTWNTVCEPIFPLRLARNRFVLGLLLNGFLTGFPFMAAIINIPQRLQTVNSTSAIGAGIRLLPLLLLSPVATSLSGLLISKLKVPPLYLLIVGGSLQAIGVGLFSSLDSSNLQIPSAQYGYQVIMGLGFGFNLSTILMMAPMVVKERDMAVIMGSVTQIRVLGGTIGLAVCSALLVNYVKAETSQFLTKDQVSAILLSSNNIALLPPEVQAQTKTVYATGYSQQMRVMLYFSIASLCSLFLLAEKRPRRLVDTATAQVSTSR